MGNFVVQQDLGEDHITIPELRDKLQHGDNSIARKKLYFCASLRFKINEEYGLPSFFTTGSCA